SAVVLDGRERWDALRVDWTGIRAAVFDSRDKRGADLLEYFAERCQDFLDAGFDLRVDPKRMIRAAVRLHRADVILQFARMIRRVTFSAAQSVLFIHPRDDADGALRLQLELLHEVRGLHRAGDARAVVD